MATPNRLQRARHRRTAGEIAGAFGCEPLEPRRLLAAFTGEEVFLAELINRARADPQAEAARLGIDLTEGLTSEELALLGPVEPLALDLSLALAARAHSMDMVVRGYFDHLNPEGKNPTDRARDAGYGGVSGESIAAGQPSAERVYETWMSSVPNRLNILSLFTSFDTGFHYDHFGAGFATDVEPAEPHYTGMFGDPGPGSTAWLLGVVYTDADADGFYSVGEGAGAVRVDVAAAADPAGVVATFTTDEAGNYQIELGDGSWILTFTDLGTGDVVVKEAMTAGQNIKVDARLAEFAPAPDDGDGGDGDGGDGDGDGGGDDVPDDHADDMDFAHASLITVSPEGGGSAAGEIGVGTDTDLFYFTSPFAGELTLTLDTSPGSLTGAITLESDVGLPLVIEEAPQGGTTVSITWSVRAGAQFFIVVGSVGGGSEGAYTLDLAVVEAEGGDGGEGDDESPGDEDPPVDATSDGSGAVTIVRTDENGRPIVYFQHEDGSWTSVDLIAEAGGPAPEGRFATFMDPESGRSSVVSATASGLAIYSRDAEGAWRVRNLSEELAAAPIASRPVTFTSRTGLVFAAGLDADGNLVVYRHTGFLNDEGESAWTFEDLTTDHLAAQGLAMPALNGSTLIAYVTAWNGLTLAGLDAEGDVHAAWWVPGMEKWALANLSATTGAPKYIGTISAYLTPWQGINIAGTDENGDLVVVWWVPGFGGDWRLSRLNVLLDGPRLQEGTIASWVTPWGGLNISGLSDEGEVVVYWWAPSGEGWQIATLSEAIPDIEPPVRGVIGHTSSTGVISILGVTEAGDLVRYWWEPGGHWAGENLSLSA